MLAGNLTAFFRALRIGGLAITFGACWLTASAHAQNPYGCGLNGGPGYRAEDGHCVGVRELRRVCGDPPETACVFEGKGARPPTCQGCGCKGGPGWRKLDGNCAGWRDLKRNCGDPPGHPCTFEGP